jgi:molybdopterin converting factor small subunit
MNITVKCYATLAPFSPQGGQFCLPKQATVHDLARALALPEQEIKIIFVNGRSAELPDSLHEGDRIGFFPPVGGG